MSRESSAGLHCLLHYFRNNLAVLIPDKVEAIVGVVVSRIWTMDADLREAKRSAQPAFDEAFAFFDAGDVDQARAAFRRCRELLPDDPVAPLHLAHCDAVARGEMDPGQEVALLQK